jgi:outer membrane autotransporter protein
MRHFVFTSSFIAAILAWPVAGFAQRQQAVGSGIIPLDATGILNGVDMSASGTTGTLSVGVPGGPATDILTSNNPYVAGPTAVSTAASSQGNIAFNSSSTVYGSIGATQPAGPFLLGIFAGNTGTTLNLMGPLFATTLNVNQSGAVNFNSGTTNITATNFAGDGTISLAPNTTVIGALTTTAGANTGTLVLGGASVLDGAVGGAVGIRAVNVAGGSNLAGVTATITGAANAYSFSLGTNTLNIGGALTIANGGPSGVINTTLASPSVYGNIRPMGATNLGATLRVNVTVPSTAVIPVGTQFNIVQTQAGTLQSGTDGSVVAVTVQNPTNPLYTFAAVPAAGTIAGLVTIRTTGIPLLVPLAPPSGPLPPILPVAAAVVPVLAAALPPLGSNVNPTTDILQVIASINALSDPAAVVAAVAQLAPPVSSLAAPLVTFQAMGQFQDILQSRLENVLCRQPMPTEEPIQACQGNDTSGNWWLKGFGYAGSQGARQAYGGYDSTIFGTMVGYDVPLGPNTRVGLGLGYAGATISDRALSNHTDFDSFQLTAYAAHRAGPWFVNGDLSVGWNDYSGTRQIAFPGIARAAHAKYSGQDYAAFATTGYDLPVAGFAVTPLASLQYSHVNLSSFTETGAGDLNLAVRSQSYDFLESGLGARVSRAFTDPGTSYVPELHVKWLHELDNPTLAQTAAFAFPGSQSFATPGLKTADDTFNVGAGITLMSCTCGPLTWSVQAVYDYYRRSDNYDAHQGVIKLTGHF